MTLHDLETLSSHKPDAPVLKLRFSSTTTGLVPVEWCLGDQTTPENTLLTRPGLPRSSGVWSQTAPDGGKLRRGEECAQNAGFWLSKHASTRASRVVGKKNIFKTGALGLCLGIVQGHLVPSSRDGGMSRSLVLCEAEPTGFGQVLPSGGSHYERYCERSGIECDLVAARSD